MDHFPESMKIKTSKQYRNLPGDSIGVFRFRDWFPFSGLFPLMLSRANLKPLDSLIDQDDAMHCVTNSRCCFKILSTIAYGA